MKYDSTSAMVAVAAHFINKKQMKKIKQSFVQEVVKNHINDLRPKTIHLSDFCIKQLSKDAIDANTDFKNYVQDLLERTAVGAVRQKSKK